MSSERASGTPAARPRRVALALGSNLGDPLVRLRAGVEALERAGVGIEAVSSVYLSAPVGYAAQPDFLNAVVVGRWTGPVEALLDAALAAEAAAGRRRTFRNAPRTLDVDLVLVDGLVSEDDRLTLPHPRWRERSFVLAPLAEVAPEWADPVTASTVQEIWSKSAASLPDVRVVAPPSDLWSPPT
jgi:2-amino-4-hydroxy-6-hydroxymethyldihydropteridine diphosphokinase